ncbi:MAG: bifunctional nuclease family protein [Planctomycetota bacterium]
MELVECEIGRLIISETQESPTLVMLREKGGKRTLTIGIHIVEAIAINRKLSNESFPRPMTHDLLKSILDGLGVTVQQVVVNDLKDNTFFAVIELNHTGTIINIDARPSDAIALALRVNAPIFVTEKVVSQAKSVEISEEKEETDKWREWLDNLKPEDFGKYRM